MTPCCACAQCQCLCHHDLTPQDYRRMTQEVLLGERLTRVAARWQTNTSQLRQVIAYVCAEANPARYDQHREGGGKVLEKLRIYATDYGFTAAPKYAAWRRERERRDVLRGAATPAD
jgi:hypothetical protein